MREATRFVLNMWALMLMGAPYTAGGYLVVQWADDHNLGWLGMLVVLAVLPIYAIAIAPLFTRVMDWTDQ